MKLRKAKRFNTIESYAVCYCSWSTCSCSCGCVCACRGLTQPSAEDFDNGVARSDNYTETSRSMASTSSQNIQL